MAWQDTIVCVECEQTKTATIPSGKSRPSICDDCRDKKAQKEEEDHLKELRKMSLEERVERLERESYRRSKK